MCDPDLCPGDAALWAIRLAMLLGWRADCSVCTSPLATSAGSAGFLMGEGERVVDPDVERGSGAGADGMGEGGRAAPPV